MLKSKNKIFTYLSFMLPFIICAIIYSIHPPVFESNDDVTILNTLSGRVTGTPSGEAMFFSVFLGLPISLLYRIIPQVQWYTLFLIGLNVLCFAIIVTCSFNKINSKYKALAIPFITSVVAVISLWSFALIQYTYVSALCGAAAIVLLFFGKREKLSIIFVLLSIMIRVQSGLISLAFYCIALFFNKIFLLEPKFKIKTILKNVVLPVFCVLIFVLCFAVADNLLKTHVIEPKGYTAFQKAQSSLVDYPMVSFENAQDVKSKYGWTEDIYNLVRQFFMMDERVTTDSMAYMALLSPLKTEGIISVIVNFNDVVLSDVTLLALFVLSLNIAMSAFGVQLYNGLNRKNIMYILMNIFSALMYIIVLMYVVYKGRIIWRAIYPASLTYMASSIVVLVLSLNNIDRKTILKRDYIISTLLIATTLAMYALNKGLYLAILIVITITYLSLTIKPLKTLYKLPIIALLVVVLVFGNLNQSKYISDKIYSKDYVDLINLSNENKKKLEEYASINKNNIYIYDISLIVDGRLNPSPRYINNVMYWGGTTYNSQFYLDQLKSLNIDKLNLNTFLLDNVYYATRYNPNYNLENLLRNIKIGKFEYVESYKNVIDIYKYVVE